MDIRGRENGIQGSDLLSTPHLDRIVDLYSYETHQCNVFVPFHSISIYDVIVNICDSVVGTIYDEIGTICGSVVGTLYVVIE